MDDVFDEILVVEFYIEILVWCMWSIGGILLIVFEVVICGNIMVVIVCVVFVIYILFFVIGFRNYGNQVNKNNFEGVRCYLKWNIYQNEMDDVLFFYEK